MRQLAPTAPLLIPGVGAQGGDAVATVRAGWRPDVLIVVNSSRAICYASSGEDFAEAARRVAAQTRELLHAARGRATFDQRRDQAIHGMWGPRPFRGCCGHFLSMARRADSAPAAAHCAIYGVVEAHKDELYDYDTSGKGTIRFQADDPLPATLVRKLVKARIAKNAAQQRHAADGTARRR